ncbi:hypothetical protein [Peribacillus deserti]|uniref:DUF2651 domain-containing protein n=1 Tax=Peribacillus deserti TaxID=673318 RepID=A0A2N5M801_9BACI|nr:hypothetical protein [Peribacillus deserti]PLT30479.1 hypothetical protein CUU66_07395 [Peribacillus deserti]
MWEIIVYIVAAPLLTLFLTITAMKYNQFILPPVIVFVVLNLFTIFVPMLTNNEWQPLFSRAIIFTIGSVLLCTIIWTGRIFKRIRAYK